MDKESRSDSIEHEVSGYCFGVELIFLGGRKLTISALRAKTVYHGQGLCSATVWCVDEPSDLVHRLEELQRP